MNFCSKNAMLALMIFFWLNASNTKASCDPYVGIAFEVENSNVCFCELYASIAFEEEKSNLCFVNFVWVLQFEYLQSI
jgi:hypothetical protein